MSKSSPKTVRKTAKLRFEYFPSTKNRQWYWRIRSSNGRIILQSEGYKRKASVLKMVATLQRHGLPLIVWEAKAE